MGELFADLEINMVITAVVFITLVVMFIVGRLTFKELIVYFMIAFALEYEYRNYIHHPENSLIVAAKHKIASATANLGKK